MNLRPSGYEPDELPDCSTPRPHSASTLNVYSEHYINSKTRVPLVLKNRDYTHTFRVHANLIAIFFADGMTITQRAANKIHSAYVMRLIPLVLNISPKMTFSTSVSGLKAKLLKVHPVASLNILRFLVFAVWRRPKP